MNSGHTVPKSMRRIQEEWQGLPLRYVYVVVAVSIVSLILVINLFISQNKMPSLIMLFLIIAFFAKFLRTPATLKRSWLSYQFFIKGLRGQNVIPKYATTAGFMKSIIPIVDFHQGGIIEFTGGHYGMLLKVDPERVSDDELDHHINSVRLLTDSLHGDIMIKSYVVSLNTSARPVEQALLSSLNEPGRTNAEQAHIYSLYQEAVENKTPIIQWKFYMFLGLGKYATLQEAIIAKQQYYLGIINRLTSAGMHIILIQNKNELGMIYRQMISQVGK